MYISTTLFSLVSIATAIQLQASITHSPSLPSPNLLAPSTTGTLTTLGHTYTAPLSTFNTFTFRNVSSGSYLFDVSSSTHSFYPLRVDVNADNTVEAWGTYRGNEWDNKGEAVAVREESTVGREPKFSFEARVGKELEYFQPRSGFSPFAILKSPMILIALASMGVIFGMPYLVDNMDPEMKAEFQEAQKNGPVSGLLAGGGKSSQLGNFDAAAWLAGSGKKDAAAGEGVTR